MPIKITTVDLITKASVLSMVEYYNTHRPKNTEILELVEYTHLSVRSGEVPLTRYGFRMLATQPNHAYANGKYKYMRWQGKTLVSIYNYPPFSPEEEILLFKIARYVLGKENVSYYRTYEQAIKHSPNYNATVFSHLLGDARPAPENRCPDVRREHVVDDSVLSLSANAGWRFPRVRI